MLFGKPKGLPVLALRDVVVFPFETKALVVARPQSVANLLKADSEDKSMLLVMQQDAVQVNPTLSELHKVGTLAKILQVLRLPDNKYRVLVRGEARVSIDKLEQQDLLWLGSHTNIEVDQGTSKENDVLMQLLQERFEQLAAVDSEIPSEMVKAVQGQKDPRKLADTLAPRLCNDATDLQNLLELPSAHQRMQRLIEVIQNKMEVFEVDKRIQDRVKQQMDRNQKEYYLNEKMNAIQKELGEEDGPSEFVEMQEKITESKLPEEAHDKAVRELKRLKKMSPMSAEATVSRTYLDWMTNLPWYKEAEENSDLQHAREVLDAEHYGLEDVKERILEYLAVRQVAPKGRSPILCLAGPPGIGKTSLAKSIAAATGRPYVRQALGGVRDESEIRGHRRTYIGSLPGKILQTLKRAGVVNPIFLLDEIDKMSGDFRHGDPAAALLEALDPEQNNSFRDHYIDTDYDLSKVMFVCTANDLRAIPGPLQDRLEILELSSYTEPEKLEIAIRHLIPKQIQQHGMEETDVAFTREALVKMVRCYTKESGVRNLERQIAKVCRKIIVQRLENPSEDPVSEQVTSENVENWLGTPKFLDREVLRGPEVGVINGLAVTPWGGELLEIEVASFDGKGEILLTGRLGDWLKESARAALSCIRMRTEEYGLEPDFYQKQDIHVHYPGNPLKTDGPSAGLAMACAMLSALTGRPLRADVAMTGEISLRGRVLAIGGVKEKLLAAHARGMKLCFLPIENRSNLDDLPDFVTESMEIRCVESIDEVLPFVFLQEKGSEAEKTIVLP